MRLILPLLLLASAANAQTAPLGFLYPSGPAAVVWVCGLILSDVRP